MSVAKLPPELQAMADHVLLEVVQGAQNARVHHGDHAAFALPYGTHGTIVLYVLKLASVKILEG